MLKHTASVLLIAAGMAGCEGDNAWFGSHDSYDSTQSTRTDTTATTGTPLDYFNTRYSDDTSGLPAKGHRAPDTATTPNSADWGIYGNNANDTRGDRSNTYHDDTVHHPGSDGTAKSNSADWGRPNKADQSRRAMNQSDETRTDDGWYRDKDGTYRYHTQDDRARASDDTSVRTAPGHEGFASPDSRILSILHVINEKEIEIGRLAQKNGSSDEVRRFGERLVRDHTDADAKVKSTARSANVPLASKDETCRLMNRDKDRAMGEDRPADAGTPRRNETAQADRAAKEDADIAELKGLTGADFDRAFADKMTQGHAEAIRMIEDARSDTSDGVRRLLDELLPALREHERMAADIAAAPDKP